MTTTVEAAFACPLAAITKTTKKYLHQLRSATFRVCLLAAGESAEMDVRVERRWSFPFRYHLQ